MLYVRDEEGEEVTPELNRIYVGDCFEIMKTWPTKARRRNDEICLLSETFTEWVACNCEELPKLKEVGPPHRS